MPFIMLSNLFNQLIDCRKAQAGDPRAAQGSHLELGGVSANASVCLSVCQTLSNSGGGLRGAGSLMSDGTNPEVGLNNVIDKTQGRALKSREISSDYFDVCRYISTPSSHLYHFAESCRPDLHACRHDT